ncbi:MULTISPECIES: ribosomal maturation YjgA family protein [Chryseobacterium]|uniref:DUF2809 domain-containing protein n=1 Tax=Chryseobacterium camelliae TaxID=1265445 RepID=A0ABU0TM64_9FLAO|nr:MULTISPECIES: DUF2809 domain-containing protein [Chryseobacterium]MDT3408006.1 hypothetical protein [Pseudacidovorax intermedius]MDQ1098137.1 hypothetical protein [Chryseobacterium camelliae]MDQ1102067.1 hypothetical protein [Chryseobacterium sp. SORGH_AS_1048]MDR6085504.1 hypothetical protein [Chryseobacterium sp. SORGH_AS_0909]MDR6129867.1 hypothetical protein [Chryseobacterium sp. SORGH_AS_1175]
MSIQFNYRYGIAAILLFLVEVFIATILKDIFFVRAYLGDVLVVILLYAFVRSFICMDEVRLILGIFLFSCMIETAQYFNIAERMGFERGSIMYIIIGNSFSWIDIVCYAAGCMILYGVAKLKS